jgi:type IV secretion system protein VirB4
MSLWPLAIGMGSAALAAGTVAVPAVQRSAFGSVEFDWLAHQLELDRVDPDNITVRCKPRRQSALRQRFRKAKGNGATVMRVYRLVGESYDTKPESQQFALHEGRTAFRHSVAALGAVVRTFAVKRHREIIHPATWPSITLAEIGKAEAELYRNAYELRWYMTIQAANVDVLERADERVFALLSRYKPTRLARPTIADSDCPLTGFLNFLVSGDLRDDLRAVSTSISANLPAADLVFTRDGDFVAHVPTPTHHRIVTIREWPDLVSGYLLHELMALPGEIEVSEVSVPISKERALFELNRKSKSQFGPELATQESLAAVELLQQGKTSLLSTQLAIVVRGETVELVDGLLADVARILANRRVSYSVETAGTPVAWFNRMPDHEALLRPLKLFAENVAALWPLEGAPTGLNESHWGKAPTRSFMTGSGQSYAVQLQCSPAQKALGNFLVIAPAGSGKSTLIMHLLGGLAKFERVRSYVLDSKEGTRFMVESMGGVYQSFDKLALNPLDATDTTITRQRLTLLIRSMLGDAGQSAGVEDILSHVVETAFDLPIEARTFNELFPLCFPSDTPARQAFSRWVTDEKERQGLYARTMNAPRDSLGGLLNQSFMVGINMNEALEDPHLGPPIVAHISNAIERAAMEGHSKGFAIFIDEAAKLLSNRAFCDFAVEMYREYRKLFGSVGMAFQDPAALHKSGIADAVIENTASFFFFPNPQGNRAAYDVFNLNEEHHQFIFGGGHEGRKVLLVKREAATGFDESVILDIDLSPLGDALRFYRSGPDAVRELQSIQAKWGNEWLAHV